MIGFSFSLTKNRKFYFSVLFSEYKNTCAHISLCLTACSVNCFMFIYNGLSLVFFLLSLGTSNDKLIEEKYKVVFTITIK